MLNHSEHQTRVFEYWEETPHECAQLLEREREFHSSLLKIPVLWGVHESTQGMRDFSKQSRLRLERVLTLGQTLGLSLEVVLGFPSHRQAFPPWTWEVGSRESISSSIWEGEAPFYSQSEVPSPRNEKIKEGFFSFIQEVISLLSLYRCPGGPVKRIHFSLLPLEFTQSLIESPVHLSHLERRYPAVEGFNSRFQTHYRSLNALSTLAGCRFVEGKRPWLFAYDYHWSRRQFLEEYVGELLGLEGMQSVRDILVFHEENPIHRSSMSLLYDSLMIDVVDGKELYPFCPEGMHTSAYTQSFQFLKWISEQAEREGISTHPLPIFCEKELKEVSSPIVICGKYLTRPAFRYLEGRLQSGTGIFFPFGLPQYDENMESQELLVGAKRESFKIEGVELMKVSKGQAQIWYPIQGFGPLNKTLASQLFAINSHLSKGTSNG